MHKQKHMPEKQYSELELINAKKEAFDRGIESCQEHNLPSAQTLEMFKAFDERLDSYQNKLDALHKSFYGNGNGEIGLVKQVDEMYKVFTRSSWAVNLIIKIFVAIGAVTGGIIGICEVFKRLSK